MLIWCFRDLTRLVVWRFSFGFWIVDMGQGLLILGFECVFLIKVIFGFGGLVILILLSVSRRQLGVGFCFVVCFDFV